MAEAPVLYTKSGNVATLTLNRPAKLNAMDEALMGWLERRLLEVEADAEVRVVILTGAGRGFCAGGDVSRDRAREGQERFFDGDLGGNVIERLNRCVLRMQQLPKPIVGSINGVAVGAGCNPGARHGLAHRFGSGPLWRGVFPHRPGAGWRRHVFPAAFGGGGQGVGNDHARRHYRRRGSAAHWPGQPGRAGRSARR